MSDMMTKHQQMARSGKAPEGYKGGGHVHMHEHAGKHHGGHSTVNRHHPEDHRGGHKHNDLHEHHEYAPHKGAKHGGSIHHVTSQTGESTSPWDTESVGTDGGGKHPGGGGTGSTRNPY